MKVTIYLGEQDSVIPFIPGPIKHIGRGSDLSIETDIYAV